MAQRYNRFLFILLSISIVIFISIRNVNFVITQSFRTDIQQILSIIRYDEYLEIMMSEDKTNSTKQRKSITTGQNPYFLTETFRLERMNQFYSWYEGNKTDNLLINADKNGPILDFVIAGMPKTGTTSLSDALSKYAPLNPGDVCTPSPQIVYYSYVNWPRKYGQHKTMRGSKCPQLLEGYIQNFGLHVPRTKLIFGIRHPVLWFQSFWNQQAVNQLTRKYANNDPYHLMHVCDTPRTCSHGCHNGKLFCVGRARFHLTIAKLGKTELSTTERQLLAPNDQDGGEHLENLNIQNPLLIYEMSELQEDYFWEGLTEYLGMNETIQPGNYHSSRGRIHRNTDHKINICDEEYDQLRASIMVYSYELSSWLQEYFVPIAKNNSRTDVHLTHPDVFAHLVEAYKNDPCNRLIRQNNGTFTTLIE